MPDSLEPLILDMMEWIAREPRSYADVIDAWRTSCPRLTVWEDAVDLGLVQRRDEGGRNVSVVLTEAGSVFLRQKRVSLLSSRDRSN
ncbi:MAG: hypothetical protein JWM36_4625 [Hyphomicrobiales bacterium]|nr:hypothetical protein [Hyphomicrobiales bacterium]